MTEKAQGQAQEQVQEQAQEIIDEIIIEQEKIFNCSPDKNFDIKALEKKVDEDIEREVKEIVKGIK